jgi:hypothetical protein
MAFRSRVMEGHRDACYLDAGLGIGFSMRRSGAEHKCLLDSTSSAELLLFRLAVGREHRELALLRVGDPFMVSGKLTGGFAIADGESLRGNASAAPHHLVIFVPHEQP